MEASREIWPSSCDLYQYSGRYPVPGAEERVDKEKPLPATSWKWVIKVPIIAIINGEGGSGGALALAGRWGLDVKNSIYAVLSSEGLLYSLKDGSRARSSRVDEDYYELLNMEN